MQNLSGNTPREKWKIIMTVIKHDKKFKGEYGKTLELMEKLRDIGVNKDNESMRDTIKAARGFIKRHKLSEHTKIDFGNKSGQRENNRSDYIADHKKRGTKIPYMRIR